MPVGSGGISHAIGHVGIARLYLVVCGFVRIQPSADVAEQEKADQSEYHQRRWRCCETRRSVQRRPQWLLNGVNTIPST